MVVHCSVAESLVAWAFLVGLMVSFGVYGFDEGLFPVAFVVWRVFHGRMRDPSLSFILEVGGDGEASLELFLSLAVVGGDGFELARAAVPAVSPIWIEWRRERDSNPRVHADTSFPGLSHRSVSSLPG